MEVSADEPVVARKRIIKFRNYKPFDESLLAKTITDERVEPTEQKNSEIIPAVSSIDFETAKVKRPIDIIEKELAGFKQDGEEEVNIVPKKPNWDLKSQVETRLDKLRKRTQRAIVEILREKLKEGDEDGETSGSEID